MSIPSDQLQPPPPPPVAVTQQAYSYHSGKGSIGSVIAVLAVITLLGVIAGMIGRLCAGRTIMGHGQFDFEGWIERKCSSCIDGRIEAPRSSVNGGSGDGDPVPVAIPIEIPEEAKQTEQVTENPPETVAS